MKIERKALVNALKKAKIFTENKSTLAVLCAVLIGDGKIRATDLETSVSIPIDIEGNEVFALNCAKLLQVVSSLDEETVEIRKVEQEGETLAGMAKVAIGKNFTELVAYDPEEFPVVEEKATTEATTISRAGLEAVSVILPKQNEGFKLSVVHFEPRRMVATDGHRLTILTGLKGTVDWLLPADSLKKILRSGKDAKEITFDLSGVEERTKGGVELPEGILSIRKKADLLEAIDDAGLKVEVDDSMKMEDIKSALKTYAEASKKTVKSCKHFQVKLEDMTITGLAAEGNYPDVNAVIPKSLGNHSRVEVDTKAFQRILQQATAVCSGSYRSARINWNGGLDILMENPEVGTYSKESIEFSKGRVDPPCTSGFNLEYLKDIADHFGDTLEFHVPPAEKDEHNRMLVMRPLVVKADDAHLFGLIMPMRI